MTLGELKHHLRLAQRQAGDQSKVHNCMETYLAMALSLHFKSPTTKSETLANYFERIHFLIPNLLYSKY